MLDIFYAVAGVAFISEKYPFKKNYSLILAFLATSYSPIVSPFVRVGSFISEIVTANNMEQVHYSGS